MDAEPLKLMGLTAQDRYVNFDCCNCRDCQTDAQGDEENKHCYFDRLPDNPEASKVRLPRFKTSDFKWRQPNNFTLTQGLRYSQYAKRGCDPEYFLWDGQERVAAFKLLPAKQQANPWFWDGFQAEVAVKPASCNMELMKQISLQMEEAHKLNLKLHPSTVWKIPEQLMYSSGEAQIALGCDASLNAYGLTGRGFQDPRQVVWRSVGGHIHFEIYNDHERQATQHINYVVKSLDAFLGIPSVCLFQNTDHFVRRRYYGLPGEYRLPPHGLEYRTLSNAWAWHPLSAILTMDLARWAFNMGRQHYKALFVCDEQTIRDTILYNDVRMAKELMRRHKDLYDTISQYTWNDSRAFWRSIDLGIDKVIPDFGRDIVNQWRGITKWEEAPQWSKFAESL